MFTPCGIIRSALDLTAHPSATSQSFQSGRRFRHIRAGTGSLGPTTEQEILLMSLRRNAVAFTALLTVLVLPSSFVPYAAHASTQSDASAKAIGYAAIVDPVTGARSEEHPSEPPSRF